MADEEVQRDLIFSSRDRHPPNEAARYLENHVALLGQPRPVLSERKGRFVLPSEANLQIKESKAMWAAADADKEQLFDLMEKAQKRLYRERSDVDHAKRFNQLRRSNWDEVMAEIQNTAVRWKSSPNKQSKVMVFIDKLGQHSQALQTWIGLLPAGDYGSSICGVFTLVIGAAGQLGKAQEAVLEALSEIPIIMGNAKRYVERYRQMRDQFLEERTFELFRAVLKLLGHVMQFFVDRRLTRVFEGIVKQDSYKQELLDNLEQVRKRAQAVNEEALQCQGEMTVNVYEQNEEIKEQNEEIKRYFQSFFELLKSNPRFAPSTLVPSYLEERPSRDEVTIYDRINVDYLAVDDDIDSVRFRSSSPMSMASSPGQRGSPLLSAADLEIARSRLLEALRFDLEEAGRDISAVLRLGDRLGEKAKARAAAMIRHDAFKSFLEEAQHPVRLLVNGGDDPSATDDISPIRVVAAELATMSPPPDTPVFCLSYFCSEHQTSPTIDPSAVEHSSCISMMASLAGQLLTQLTDRGIPTNLSFLTDSMLRKVSRLEPAALCGVFRRLVKQAPPRSVILCIIDEISAYEIRRLVEDTSLVMEKLVRLTRRKEDGRPIFKLLVTCQGRAREVSDHFSGCTLDLQEDLDEDSFADWTISTFAK